MIQLNRAILVRNGENQITEMVVVFELLLSILDFFLSSLLPCPNYRMSFGSGESKDEI